MSDPAFKVNEVYSFAVYPAEIIGNNYSDVTVLGVISPVIAQSYTDIEALHAQVYPYLPAGTPNDARGYDYLMLKTKSGATTVLGIPCINVDSIVIVQSGTAVIEIFEVTSQDFSRISDALVTNGFPNFTMKMK